MKWIQTITLLLCGLVTALPMVLGVLDIQSWASFLTLWWIWFALSLATSGLSGRWGLITRLCLTGGLTSLLAGYWWQGMNPGLSVDWFSGDVAVVSASPWYLYGMLVGLSVISWLWIQYSHRIKTVSRSLWNFGFWLSMVSLSVLLFRDRGVDWTEAWTMTLSWLLSLLCLGDCAWVFWQWRSWDERVARQSLLLNVFFRRINPISSVLDSLEELFGIDVQGTWIIQYVRSMLEPLLYGLIVVGWLTTSLVMVHPTEQGVRSTLGVVEQDVLDGGLHLKWPWPLGSVQTVSTQRIHQLSIGHSEDPEELDDEGGPESILWANQHVSEEFLLLLGDGHDVISADGTLEYRIVDAHAYLFNGQNPEEVLESVVYQVLMEETASRTLEEALSENLSMLAQDVTVRITDEMQKYALGIEPLVFTFTALHPPVSVAKAYQEVVSAQIDQLTKRYRAEQYQLSSIPKERAEQLRQIEKSKQSALTQLAAAKGEAVGFEALRQTVRGAQDLYRFRVRQDNLEKSIAGRSLIVLDHRLEEQGAALWIQP